MFLNQLLQKEQRPRAEEMIVKQTPVPVWCKPKTLTSEQLAETAQELDEWAKKRDEADQKEGAERRAAAVEKCEALQECREKRKRLVAETEAKPLEDWVQELPVNEIKRLGNRLKMTRWDVFVDKLTRVGSNGASIFCEADLNNKPWVFQLYRRFVLRQHVVNIQEARMAGISPSEYHQLRVQHKCSANTVKRNNKRRGLANARLYLLQNRHPQLFNPPVKKGEPAKNPLAILLGARHQIKPVALVRFVSAYVGHATLKQYVGRLVAKARQYTTGKALARTLLNCDDLLFGSRAHRNHRRNHLLLLSSPPPNQNPPNAPFNYLLLSGPLSIIADFIGPTGDWPHPMKSRDAATNYLKWRNLLSHFATQQRQHAASVVALRTRLRDDYHQNFQKKHPSISTQTSANPQDQNEESIQPLGCCPENYEPCGPRKRGVKTPCRCVVSLIRIPSNCRYCPNRVCTFDNNRCHCPPVPKKKPASDCSACSWRDCPWANLLHYSSAGTTSCPSCRVHSPFENKSRWLERYRSLPVSAADLPTSHKPPTRGASAKTTRNRSKRTQRKKEDEKPKTAKKQPKTSVL